MSLLKRYLIFAVGILIQAAGISLVVKSLLGTSPISSIPYVLSLWSNYTLGEMTFAVNMLFFLAQILILRRNFEWVQVLQVPVTLLFSGFIDVTMFLFAGVMPEAYLMRLIVLFSGAAFIALGVALQVIAHVLMLPGEGIVNAIATHWKIDFGKTKTAFDISLVLCAAGCSAAGLHSIEGIREGTLISAAITGSIARFFIRHLSRMGEDGQLTFCWGGEQSELPAVQYAAPTDRK